ncbi:aldehyde dehydrogenase (NADP(+)) [Polycladidibacter hongkongensis]|uniref:aldehyde dehydrogenase (NADP(+)) n=1 Tax=Polycladidibacter hongkongensis TaxID=1647556 RepID=UPI000834BCBF|nr:aldehyde dehydrogenase (NADP(+)) [Pseudovibrio hongkongensis]
MQLTGKQLIAGEWVAAAGAPEILAIDPVADLELSGTFFEASLDEVERAVAAADIAFLPYSRLSDVERAAFLDEIAVQIEGAADDIVLRGQQETGLPEMRLKGELGRTCGQLRLFSNLLRRGDWRRPVIDQADLARQPVPKPDTRLTQIALGPVVVFAASNFPLAFSTAGGDTASALAAGCPVIVKAHSAHPGTSELVAACIAKAIAACDVPAGTFGLLHGPGQTIGAALVRHPKIKAGGFTGSVVGGRALYDLAQQRPEPIPFFGELGSTNPVFLCDHALQDKGASIAAGFVGAMVLGAGQFCTNPGMLVLKDDVAGQAFLAEVVKGVEAQQGQAMLTRNICSSFNKGNAARADVGDVQVLARGQDVSGNFAQPMLMQVSAADYLANAELQEEIFGPSTLVVLCRDEAEVSKIAASFHGHLTASIFMEDADAAVAGELANVLQDKVGRLIYNGFGTGVEVCASMSHGGPYPSSTSVQSTSVGERAIDRFVRPICYQGAPQALLPAELRDDNPLGLMRLVDGVLSDKKLS